MKIAVYAFDGITMFHLAAPLIVFETASSLGLAPEWRTIVWTLTADPSARRKA